MPFWKFVAVIGACLGLTWQAHAQEPYPNRLVTLVHGFAAGGNADVIARIVADGLAQRLGKPVIVEPRAGAGGTLASDYVAKATPDGHTLIMLTGGHSVSGALYKSLPFKPVDDFQMLSTVIFFPFVIAVNTNHRFKSLADLIAEAKAKPDTLTFSSVGVGSTQHLAGELLASMAGIKLVHVPYRGGGGPINDVLGGQIDILVDTLTIAAPQLAAGSIRGLGITSATPWFSLPGIPTVAATVPGYEVRSWLGIATAKNVPQPIVERLNREIRAVLESSAVKEKLQAMGNEVRASSPEEMRTLVASEIERWKGVIKDAGIPQQ
ncbi:tripartite tricarboxylate transporter substrate binding protein [Bradyrhizobium prioriisuperbiae]|uniref:Bug family tripartite tricarboxylate transporter substrate binding protein n=1 Tax=Bradyrhizobium prioriisuperbiae TaxID=2854389 RepID=UPI0028EBAD21|nr:tripartite tricarboxylate transporter substrate binding protein [Bradyrhizobium prioritasuperba]